MSSFVAGSGSLGESQHERKGFPLDDDPAHLVSLIAFPPSESVFWLARNTSGWLRALLIPGAQTVNVFDSCIPNERLTGLCTPCLARERLEHRPWGPLDSRAIAIEDATKYLRCSKFNPFADIKSSF